MKKNFAVYIHLIFIIVALSSNGQDARFFRQRRTPAYRQAGASGGHPVNMYSLYILKSQKDLGYYIGITENVDKRLIEHNLGKTKSTKRRVPFIVAYVEEFDNKTEARKREIFLKKNYQERRRILNIAGFAEK